jgi:hypothetical protein
MPMYAFVASLPFERIGASGVEGMTLTISRVLGYLWIATCLLSPQVSLKRVHRVVAAMALFVLAFFTRSLLIESAMWPAATRYTLMLLQMTGMVWLLTNTVGARPRLYESIAWVFGTACATLALLQALGLTQIELQAERGRVSMFFEDPNTLSGKLAIGLVLLIGLTWNRARFAAWVVLAVGLPTVTLTILSTGSRGGLVALLAGLVVLALPTVMTGRGLSRVKHVILMISITGMLIYGITTNNIVTERWSRTFRAGDFSRRELLYPRAVEMIIRKPMLGWGPMQNYSALAEGLGMSGGSSSTENTFIWALTAVGFLGASPFLFIIYLAGRSAWSLRRTMLGWTPIAALVSTVVFSCTIEWQHNKVYWLILAMTVAAAQGRRREGMAVRISLRHAPTGGRLPER